MKEGAKEKLRITMNTSIEGQVDKVVIEINLPVHTVFLHCHAHKCPISFCYIRLPVCDKKLKLNMAIDSTPQELKYVRWQYLKTDH